MTTGRPGAGRQKGGTLRWSSPSQPGIRRLRCGRGFRYLHANGQPVRDPDTLARIRALAIPPAYEDVWICRWANGHLQATGVDARQRRQYRYHPMWRQQRDADKFGRMVAFGRALPALRRRLRKDLAAAGDSADGAPGPGREQVLALVVALLDATALRIGNAEYARHNRTFGLTTLRDRHARAVGRDRLRLRFRGKGGLWQEARIDEPALVRAVRRCQQLPGQTLFQYVDGNHRCRAVSSGMVNDYLRQATGGFLARTSAAGRPPCRPWTCCARCPRPGRRANTAAASCRSRRRSRSAWDTHRRSAASPISTRWCSKPGGTAACRGRQPARAAAGAAPASAVPCACWRGCSACPGSLGRRRSGINATGCGCPVCAMPRPAATTAGPGDGRQRNSHAAAAPFPPVPARVRTASGMAIA